MNENLFSAEFYAYLIQQGILSKKQLHECLKIQQELRSLGLEERSVLAILLEKKYLTREQMSQIKASAKQAVPTKQEVLPQIPGYLLKKKIGQGGMGCVYLAHQISMERDVALKILSQKMIGDKLFVARFYREARASAALNHLNIVSGIDVGEANGFYYFAMEYVEGKNLAHILEQGPLPEPQALKIVRQVARALEHAHQIQMVHRDIKPDNLILTKAGVLKLLDFGLAKRIDGNNQLTRIGTAMGTPSYVSPEQASGELTDIRSDIYSLGATFFHLVLGRTPFIGKNALVIMTKHINEPVPNPCKINPKINVNVGQLILKMMEKNRTKRFQTPKELIQALDALEISLTQNTIPNTHFSSEMLESISDDLLIESDEFAKEIRLLSENNSSSKTLNSIKKPASSPPKNASKLPDQISSKQENTPKKSSGKTKKNTAVSSDALLEFHKKVTGKNIRSKRKQEGSNGITNFIFLVILSITGLFIYHYFYYFIYQVDSPLPAMIVDLFYLEDPFSK